MTAILEAIAFWIIGVFSFPLLVFLRARRDSNWDDSNITNMLRLLSHIITHPSDFGKMQYKDGRRPFWYISKDEFSQVVRTRPDKDAHKN